MKIELNIKNEENIIHLSDEQIYDINEIVEALISSGGLTGVKGGQTIIHFDPHGVFQKIELKYFPYFRRKL